jgi:general secretion pathway protein D
MKHAAVFCLALFIVLIITAPVPAFSEEKRSAENIAFNFVDVDLPTVIKFISEITSNNFVFDDRIKGKITIIAPAKLSIDESFSLFTSVLSLKGYTIIPAGPKTYKIILSSQAKEEGKISTEETIPVNEAYITKLIPTQHIKAEDAVPFLRPVVSRDGHISAFGPGNLLLVVDSALNIDKIASILKLIDQPSALAEEAKINVYFLENADATNLAKVLEGIIKNLQASYRSLRDKQRGPSDAPPLSVMPDKTTNSLIIIAPSQDYDNIVQVIKTLDKRRKQVYVEAMIIEASIDKLRDLGTKWRAVASHNNEPIVVGGFGNVSSTTLLSIISGLTGFTAGGMGNFLDVPITSISSSGTVSTQNLTSPGFAALFSLSDFRDAVNVLSTPQVLTSDNEEAEIVVGENVPFISKRERDITTTNTVLSSIERKDVGITLRLTPQITEGDYVKLDIYQEISALKDTPESVLTTVGPTTTKRSTKTSVSVKDGRTVVIGGLMQEKDEENVTKMPLLGDIPGMGWLFKSKSVSKNKTNLLVFLSPHIVKEAEQLSQITDQKHKDFSTREKLYAPGELMVKFREGVLKDRITEIIAQRGAAIIKYFEDINVYHIKLKPDQEVEEAIKELSSLPEVLYAEPNYKVKIDKNPPSPARDPAPAPVPGPTSDKDPGKKTADTQPRNFEVALIVSDKSEDPQQILPGKDDVNHIASGEAVSLPKDMKTVEGSTVKNSNHEETPEVKTVLPSLLNDEKTAPSKQDQNIGSPAPPPAMIAGKSPDPVINEVPEAQPLQMNNPGPAVTESLDKPVQADQKKTLDADKTIAVANAPGKYLIQVGAWQDIRNAQRIFEKLKINYPKAYVIEEGSFTKIRISGIMTRQQGIVIIKELKSRFSLEPILIAQKI